MQNPILLENGDVLVSDGDHVLRFSPGESDYGFWLERTRARSRFLGGPLTGRQLIGILIGLPLMLTLLVAVVGAVAVAVAIAIAAH